MHILCKQKINFIQILSILQTPLDYHALSKLHARHVPAKIRHCKQIEAPRKGGWFFCRVCLSTVSERAEAMQNPVHPGSARYSLPARCETAGNPAYVRQTDPFSVLDASPPSGEHGWSSEGTGRGGRNDQRGVFGNGVTSVARGPLNR